MTDWFSLLRPTSDMTHFGRLTRCLALLLSLEFVLKCNLSARQPVRLPRPVPCLASVLLSDKNYSDDIVVVLRFGLYNCSRPCDNC